MGGARPAGTPKRSSEPEYSTAELVVAWLVALRSSRTAAGSASVLAVLASLASYIDEGWRCAPGQAELVLDVGCNERTVRQALRWGEENGWLHREVRGGRSPLGGYAAVYSLTRPRSVS